MSFEDVVDTQNAKAVPLFKMIRTYHPVINKELDSII